MDLRPAKRLRRSKPYWASARLAEFIPGGLPFDLLPEVAAGRIAPGALDAISQERLRIFNMIVSPAVSENRRILQERDPARRRAEIARFDALA